MAMMTCPLCRGAGSLTNSQAAGGSMVCLLCDGKREVEANVGVQIETETGIAVPPAAVRTPAAFDASDWK